MLFYLIYIGVPVALYLVLCLLPRGVIGWLLYAVAALAVFFVWLNYRGMSDPWGQMLAGFLAVGIALAIIPRLLRDLLNPGGHLLLVVGLPAVVLGLAWWFVIA